MAEIHKWSGIRNTTSPERFKLGDLHAAIDVDIDNSMKILSREGQTVVSATAAHSLYADPLISVLAQGTNLKLINSDFSFTQLASLTSSNPISYCRWHDTVYYSNGVDNGRIANQTPLSWGIAPPAEQPTATGISGDLLPGTYLYAITYLRNDGQESGTGLSGSVYLPSGGGIQFTSILASTDPNVSGIILYVSSTNGETLYKTAVIPNGQTNFQVTELSLDNIPLITQFKGPPLAGTIVRYYKGTMRVVSGNVVYISDPFAPELFDQNNFEQYPGQITMYEPLESGIYVATYDETWWVTSQGSIKLFDYGAVPGTSRVTNAAVLETNYEGESRGEQAGKAVIWTTKHGVCAGREGGACVNLTETKYSFPTAVAGAALIREDRGYAQYVTTLRDAGAANNSYTGE